MPVIGEPDDTPSLELPSLEMQFKEAQEPDNIEEKICCVCSGFIIVVMIVVVICLMF